MRIAKTDSLTYEKHKIGKSTTSIKCSHSNCGKGYLCYFAKADGRYSEEVIAGIGKHKLTRSEIGTNAWYDNEREVMPKAYYGTRLAIGFRMINDEL